MVAQLLYSSEFSHVTLYRELLRYSVIVVSSERKAAIKTATKLDRAFDVLLTVHLSVILVINQLNAQILVL
jgi:hypothetical protein